MPATFAISLCGYRPNGNPNTSDNHDELSKTLAVEMFDAMGVPRNQVVGTDPGNVMEQAIVEDLRPRRRDLDIRRSRAAAEFEQYAHLSVYPDFRRAHMSAMPRILKMYELAGRLPLSRERESLLMELDRLSSVIETQDLLTERLKADMPEESFLKVDITCGLPQPNGPQLLAIALSSKWSLRTDRAQDCISQGSKLANQRRGKMPHFAVVTMETRPAMLKILADGSGSIDCVYHLNLPALAHAIENVRKDKNVTWGPGRTFDRLVQQRRLRDYDDLVSSVSAVPVSDSH